MKTDYLLTLPCDGPFINEEYFKRMINFKNHFDIRSAHDGFRIQPVHALIKKNMLSSLKNVRNIKVLYGYKSEIKEKIKINNSKIKVLYDLGMEYMNKIEKLEKNVSKIMKNHKKYKKFVCEYCAVKTLTKKDLDKHECEFSFYRGVPGHYGDPVYDHKLHEILIELNTLKYNLLISNHPF